MVNIDINKMNNKITEILANSWLVRKSYLFFATQVLFSQSKLQAKMDSLKSE